MSPMAIAFSRSPAVDSEKGHTENALEAKQRIEVAVDTETEPTSDADAEQDVSRMNVSDGYTLCLLWFCL